MELFKNTNFDFLGKKWPFIIASLVLTVAGFASILMQGGLKFGIDFKGGTLMTVKFAQQPPLEKIRSAFARSGRKVTVWTLADSKRAGEPDVRNTFGEPERISIRKSMLSNRGGKFDYSFPSLSLTVLSY